MTAPRDSRRGRRAAVLLLWLAALALAAWQIAHTRFTADLSAFLPASPDSQQRVLIEQIESGAPSRTLLVAIDGGTSEQRAAASKALAAALRADPRFVQVQNGERDAYAAIGRWLHDQRYRLSPAVTPERFTPAGLREAIEDTLSVLGTPGGAALSATLESDPTGETLRIAEGLLPSSGPKVEHGVWAARSGERALLLVALATTGADLDAQQAAIGSIRSVFAALPRPVADGLTLQMSGTPLFAVKSRARIESEVMWLSVAGTLVMGALLLASFASPLALGVAMLPVATGIAAGIAAVSLGFGTVHGITLGFGATLIGEAVDYAIYYLIQARDGYRRWLADSWPTVRLGLATSICGFAALVFSGFPGLAQLGVFSIAGLLAAAATTRFVLPVLQPDGARGSGLRGYLGAFSIKGARMLPRWRRPSLALGAAALAVLLLSGNPWRADLASLSPVPRESIELDTALRADLGASDARFLAVVQAADTESTLVAAEALAARLDALVDAGRLAGFDSITRLLPSRRTQQQRIGSLPEAPALAAALDEAMRGLPLPASRLAPFIADVQRARGSEVLTARSLASSPVAPLVDALLLSRRDGSAVALMPLRLPAGAAPEAALAAVRDAVQGVTGAQLLDVKGELDSLYARYLGQAIALASLGALAVVALMAVSLRSWRRLAAVCQPLVLAALITTAGLVLAGVALSILHLVGLLLVFAIGSNYALFFDAMRPAGTAGIDDEATAGTLASLLLASVTTVLSFALLALSTIPALSAIGHVVAPGALLALLLAAAFAPPPAQPAAAGTV